MNTPKRQGFNSLSLIRLGTKFVGRYRENGNAPDTLPIVENTQELVCEGENTEPKYLKDDPEGNPSTNVYELLDIISDNGNN